MGDVKLNITVNAPRVTKFAVGGRTLPEAKRHLDRREEWGLYDATRNFKSSAQVDADGNVMSVTMIVNPVIELPAWTGYGAATKSQKAAWDSMYGALKAHENKHHAIQVACIEELKKAIRAAKELDASTLDDIIQELRDSAQKKQDDYDTSSEHGAREGVVLRLDA